MTHAIISWNDQRERVFLDRYALKDVVGNVLETRPEEMWQRVAKSISNNPWEEELFLSVLEGFQFVPSGRILSGAEAGQEVTYYNCFVIGVRAEDPTKGNDSRHGIMDTLRRMVEITSRGGGVGINWSTLRPSGGYIKGVHGHSSGANSWMRGADGLADQIRQGGSRTAALMFLLEDWHPDIVEFVSAKDKFARANFSVGISDRFMRALFNDEDWTLVFPDTSHPVYDRVWDGNITRWIQSGLPVVEHYKVSARKLWRLMCEGAHGTGSPGVVFLERCNKMANTWYLEELTCTNPCGEQPLPAGGSCNLGSINLTAFWDPITQDLNWKALGRAIKVAVRFLDNVIDKSVDIDSEIGDIQRLIRRVGLGTMGLADVLILSKVRYGSDESLSYIEKLYSFVRDTAYLASVELAKEKGPAPGLDLDKFFQGHYVRNLPAHIRAAIREHGIRNLQLLTQAPTGTTSIIAGASSGIEPIFSAGYVRRDTTGEHVISHPLFQGDEGPHLVTAGQIDIVDHIRVQATIQKFVDSSISKTINLPSTASVEDIDAAYRMAYEAGCKGVTVYRSGSLGENVLEEVVTCEACSM